MGLGARLAFVHAFPTVPYSDFFRIVSFALDIKRAWLENSWHWRSFGPVLPFLLSVLFRIFPGPPADVARLATAVACGLVPVFPFLIWRGVLPLWVRALAGFLLALWPGQVLFSGVVAQDNWVLLPTVALGALAARSLVARDSGYPVAAGLLFGLGVGMRQEMLIASLPLLAAAAGLGSPEGRRLWKRWPRLARGAAATVLPLLLLMAYRGVATGRFALTSEHGGLAVLGAYIPGATVNFWADPRPYVAVVEPALLYDLNRLHRETYRLALREALRRPGFHAARIAVSILKFEVTSEGDNLYWCVGAPETLPEPLRARGQAFMMRVGLPLRYELLAIQGLFLASLVLALRQRNLAILTFAAAVLLKVSLHGLIAAQSRYVLAATALELLAVALGAWEASRARTLRPVLAALGVGLAGAIAMNLALWPALDWVYARDRPQGQLTYHFPVNAEGSKALLDCVVSKGLVTALAPLANLRLADQDPAPGAVAAADCRLTGPVRHPLVLRVRDPYALGGLPGRIVQRVTVDGAEALAWDVGAEPWTGWNEVPLGTLAAGRSRQVRIEIVALHPDPGAAWGNAVNTQFELVERR